MANKSAHVLEPGDKLLRSGKWIDKHGKPGVGPCIDPERAAAGSQKQKPKKAAAKKKGA